MALSKPRQTSPDILSANSTMEVEVSSTTRPTLMRQFAVENPILDENYNPVVEQITPPSSPVKDVTPDSPFVNMGVAELLETLMTKRARIETMMSMCEEGSTSFKMFQADLDGIKEEVNSLLTSDGLNDHGTPRRRRALKETAPLVTSSTPSPATTANCPPLQEKQQSPNQEEKQNFKKTTKKSTVVRKVPTDFKVVNLVKKKKRFDGMTFRLDGNFFVSAKEVTFGRNGSNTMEAICIDRHFNMKHPNNDGAMVPKVSPMTIPRAALDSLITAVRTIVKSRELDVESMPPPIPGRDGVFDFTYMTKGVYTSDRFVLDKMLSVQVEEIQFSNAKGSGVFDVMAITKTLNTVDKATKKNKTFVQQVPMRILPGLLRALTTIAKFTREVDPAEAKEQENAVAAME